MPFSHRIRAALLGSVAFSFAMPATAQEAYVLDPIWLARSKREVQTDTATAQTVVNQEEIRDRQAGTIAELIDSVPGVSLINGAEPQGAGINIRGFGANGTYGSDQKVGIQIDGASVGAEELYRIGTQLYTDPELYKEVTVVRGMAGTFEYGSGMIGGLVQLETKDASDFTGGVPGYKLRQTLQYGSNGNQAVSSTILAWQPTENFELLGNYTYRSQDIMTDGAGDDVNPEGFSLPSYALKGKYTFGATRNQYLSLSLSDTQSDESDVPYDSFTATSGSFGNVDREVHSRTAVLTYGFDHPDTDLINVTASLSYADQQIDSSYVAGSSPLEGTPGEASILALANADHRYETTKLTLKNQALFGTGLLSHDLRTGIELSRRERADASSAPGGTDERWALFVVDDVTIGDHWTITPALRYESQSIGDNGYGDYDNDALMGGLTARYAFGNGFAVFGSAAYNENLPILDDLTTPGYMRQSEKARTYELGFSFDRSGAFAEGDDLGIKVNAYRTSLWDVTSYSGVGEVEMEGTELEASYSTEAGYYADLSVNKVWGQQISSGVEAYWRGTPANTAQLTLGKRWGDEVDLSWEIVAADDMDRSASPTPGYNVHNLRATYKPQTGVLEGVEMRFGVENVLDREYRTHLATRNAPGRTFKLTLAKTF